MYGYGNWGFNNNIPLQIQPQLQQPQVQPTSAQAQQIIQVHGQDGAKAFALSPNSSVLLMDQTDNIVWAKVTDGAGFATLKGFRLIPLEEEKQKPQTADETSYVTLKDFNALKARFEKLMEELGDAKSNS